MAQELKKIEEYGGTEFTRWIDAAESGWTAVEQEYKDSRKYYEDVQTPSTAPSDKEYVSENLMTDLINGLTGQLIGGELSFVVSGGGSQGDAIRELASDIIERNMFQQRHVEPITNMFYTEGMGGIYTMFNPFKISQYGIGMPVIYHLLTSDGELLLDPDSRGFMHEDDVFRIFKQKRLIEYAEKKYTHLKGKIKPAHTTTKASRSGNEKYCDVYIIEFVTTDILTIGQLEDEQLKKNLLTRFEEKTKVEIDRYWQADMVNRTELAEKMKPTGFSRFRLQPVIHTPRIQAQSYPMGIAKLMKGKQDQINTVGSVALEAVKSDIKNLLILVNVPTDQQKILEREAAKTNGIAAVHGQNVQIIQAERKGISPAIMEWYMWQRKSFDEVSGRYAPERGATDVGLSGKAIGLLQSRGQVPELTKKVHLEYAFTEMANVILECIGKKMSKQPFEITRSVEGAEQTIMFNTDHDSSQQLNEQFSTVSGNIVNDLSQVDIDEIDISAKVVMDTLGRDSLEANKALVAQEAGLLSRKDTTKKLYKEEWKELMDNKNEEDQALQILSALMKTGPENIAMLASQAKSVDEFITSLGQNQLENKALAGGGNGNFGETGQPSIR